MAAASAINGEKNTSLKEETERDIARIKTVFSTYYNHVHAVSKSEEASVHAALEEGDLRASTVLGLLFENRWGAVNGLMDPQLFQVGSGKNKERTRSHVKGELKEALKEEVEKGPLRLDVFGSTSVSLLAFVKALMTMENEDVDAATVLADACAQYCANDSPVSKKPNDDPQKIIFDTAHAEAKLAGSVLLFLQPSLTHALQGGWALRKCYNQFFDCLERAQIKESLIRECGSVPISSDTLQQFYSQWEAGESTDRVAVFPNLLPPQSHAEIKKTMPVSVASSILFGMGGFQLVLSLLPPTVKKVISFFGFQGSRGYGISCLRTSFLSGGLHAPLALCVLVTYYIGTSLWLRDPSPEMMEEARLLLELALHIYPSSVLLHWLQARWYRVYRNPLSGYRALSRVATLQHMPLDQRLEVNDVPVTQNPTDDDSIGWRGMKSICLYELGWASCLLVEQGRQNQRFSEAAHYFHRLRLLSMWSISLYAYLAGSCFLAAVEIRNATALLKEVESNVQQTSGRVPPIEQLARRRARRILHSIESKHLGDQVELYGADGMLHTANFTCFSPALELIYLWNVFPKARRFVSGLANICQSLRVH
eukprot:gb/GECG01001835.1/.p1 GENE.gb/GECG01001835.1/~~gb/GECG01001835.1/.p1  ORF type:complete len:595 (+),score=67.51 gb/GECG01001835.1/:1-1785(+)